MVSSAQANFCEVRQYLRSCLIASLLVLGHVLLTAAPATTMLARYREYQTALSSTSTMIFLTLLWTTFTLLESSYIIEVEEESEYNIRLPVDEEKAHDRVGSPADVSDSVPRFERTWMEFTLGWVIWAGWMYCAKDTLVVLDVMLSSFDQKPYTIAISYGLTILSLTVLQLYFTLAIVIHGQILNRAMWQGRTRECLRLRLGDTHDAQRLMLGREDDDVSGRI